MSFFDTVKKAGQKTKLQGEIALLDREITTIKRAFGVELFDLLASSVDGNGANPTLLTKEPDVAAAFELFYKEVQVVMAEKEAKSKEIEHTEAKADTRLPATSAGEKFGNFTKYVGEQSHATKLKAEIALKDRTIKQKKEAFGLDVFDKIVLAEGQLLTGLKAVMQSKIDKDIMAAIDFAKTKVKTPMNKKDLKNREIENLQQI